MYLRSHHSRLGIFLLGIMTWSLGSCQSAATSPGVPATVERVVSGQTIEVLIPSESPTQRQRIRLAGMSAPDLKQQPWGPAAQDQLRELLGLSQGDRSRRPAIRLELLDTKSDRYQRRWAYVWYEGNLLNEVITAQGYGLIYRADPKRAIVSTSHNYQPRLRQAQTYARIMGYGIWASDNPMGLTPHQFRRQP